MSAAMKLVVNSAYGYLAAGGGLTRFADVHAANEVTRRGREMLDLMCRELAARGVTLLEADTDGVYFAVPEGWTEADERRVVAEVAALLPPLVQLEFEGRYRAMLSHEPKNYALLGYDGALRAARRRRSDRAAPSRSARPSCAARIECLLAGDVGGRSRDVSRHRRRAAPARAADARRLVARAPDEDAGGVPRAVRDERRELAYEAMLASGRRSWNAGERVRVYRTSRGSGRLVGEDDPRDYDVEHYVRVLRDTFAERLARAFTPDDFDAVFDDPAQLSLFPRPLDRVQTILTGSVLP